MKTKWIEIMIIVMALGLLSLCFAGWDADKPADSDAIYTWDNSIRANNAALEAIFGVGLISAPVPSLNVQQYGALANGTTDDSAAIQAAINAANTGTIKRVYFPAGTSFYSIETEITLYGGIEYYGDGVNSQIRQVTSEGNVLVAAAQDNIIIHDLYLYGPGDTSGGSTGHGIHLNDCDYAKVYNIKIENNGLSGITFKDCDYGWIKNNLLVNGGKDSTASCGILLRDSCSYNHIASNMILNDRQGIWLVTITAGDYVSYNTIIGNTIKTCDRYGIVLYNTGLAGYMYGNQIIGNIIRDISDVTATDFGAGIYCIGIKWTTIADNYIENTNQGTTSDANLAPGGIGVIGNYVIIANNTIQNAQWHGIIVLEAGASAGSHYTISNNIISDSVKAGLHTDTADNVNIVGNLVQGGDLQGISATGGGTAVNLIIADNICIGDNNAEISVSGYDYVKITDNVASDSVTSTGIFLTTSNYVTILNNVCNGNAIRGIDIASTNTYVTIHKNTCVGNDYGISVAAATGIVDFKDNIVTGSGTADWTNGPFTAFTNTDATPSVKGGRYFLTVGTTAITDFDDPYIGQVIIILADSTISITDGTNILLTTGGSWTMTSTDTLTLVCRTDLKWYEISRGDNG